MLNLKSALQKTIIDFRVKNKYNEIKKFRRLKFLGERRLLKTKLSTRTLMKFDFFATS